MPLYWIEPGADPDSFPPVELALDEPDGLLCFGGDLSPQRLLVAYRQGIFPWYSAHQPILWWSPNPRCVLLPGTVKVRRSLRKTLRNAGLGFSMDQAFEAVIKACAEPRDEDGGTWITEEMQAAYTQLHRLGHAHSIEIWDGKTLVGGLYGIAIGQVFFGESMFSRQANASKVALACLGKRLQAHGFRLIDCQVSSSHLHSLGAQDISRQDFIERLGRFCTQSPASFEWSLPVTDVRAFYFSDDDNDNR